MSVVKTSEIRKTKSTDDFLVSYSFAKISFCAEILKQILSFNEITLSKANFGKSAKCLLKVEKRVLLFNEELSVMLTKYNR